MKRINRRHKNSIPGEHCKHPGPFLKKLGNGTIRRQPLEAPEVAKWHSKKDKRYRRASVCPFCLSNIRHQYKGMKYKQLGSCKKCSAYKISNLQCTHCKSNKIWQQNGILMCKNCGKKSAI